MSEEKETPLEELKKEEEKRFEEMDKSESSLPPVEAFKEQEQPRMQSLRLSGDSSELSEEEYKKVYCRAVNDGDKLDFYLKAIKDQTPEELVDTIGQLSQFMLRVKVVKQAAKITLEDRKITLSTEQRELLRLRDQQYKPKKVEEKKETSRAPRRKSGTAKSEDAAQMMANLLGIPLDKAKAMISNAKEE